MPRKLKVYQTSLGFYDLAVAAPSMAAALRAWGSSENLFQQGFAKESEDTAVIAAAMAQPGVVLRRPVGSTKSFKERAELPTAESLSVHFKRTEAPPKKPAKLKSTKTDKQAERDAIDEAERKAAEKVDEAAERKAAAAFEKEERRRELQRQKEEATAAKVRARRHATVERAKSALDDARREHDERAASLEKERDAIERRAENEEMRWQKLRSRLEAAGQKARV
jgi:colicin import membrane protein